MFESVQSNNLFQKISNIVSGASEKVEEEKNVFPQDEIQTVSNGEDIIISHQAENKPVSNSIKADFEKTKKEQGTIGNLWGGFKNLTGIGDGSDKVEKAINQLDNGEISEDDAKKVLEDYKDGQKVCVDVAADIVSGIVAIGAFALAVPSGGASIPVGLALSTAVGAGIKTGIKCADAKLNDREYNFDNAAYDLTTGAVNGILAPLTNGLGNTVVKAIGSKLGLEVAGTAATKSTFKNILLNQSINVTGGTIKNRAAAIGAGMMVDGSVSGGIYNASAAAAEGKSMDEIMESGAEGVVGGLVGAPIIGGGFHMAGKIGKEIGNEIFGNYFNLSRDELIRYKSISNILKDINEKRGNWRNHLNNSDIAEFCKLEPEQFERAKEMLYIQGRIDDTQFRSDEIIELAKLEPEQFKRAKFLFYLPERKSEWQMKPKFIIELAKLEPEQFEMAKSVLRNKKLYCADYDISKLAKLTSEQFKRVEESFPQVQGRSFTGAEKAELAKLEPEKFEKAKSFLFIEERDQKDYNWMRARDYDQFSATEIIALVNATSERLEKLRTIIYEPKNDVYRFKESEIAELAKLEQKNFERIEKFLDNPNLLFKGSDIIHLAKLEPEKFQRVELLLEKYKHFKGSEILELANLEIRNFEDTMNNVEKQKSIVMSNRDKYINGELDENESIRKVNEFFRNNYKGLMISTAAFDDRTINTLLRMRFDNAGEYLRTISRFNSNDIELLSKLSQSTKQDGSKLTEKEKIGFINLIEAYKQNNLLPEKMQKMADEGVVNIEQLNRDLFAGILKKTGLTDEELAKIPYDKLTSWDMTYMHLLAKENDSSFGDLLRATNLDDFNRYIKDTSNVYGQTNAITKQMFEENGMDYNAWLKSSEDNNVHFGVKDKNFEKLSKITSDIKIYMKNLTAKSYKIRQKYKNNIINDEFEIPKTITNNGLTVNCQTKDGMEYFIKSILEDLGCMKDGKILSESEIDTKSIYARVKNDVNNPQRAENANAILTEIAHLKEKLKAIKDIEEIQSTKTLDWTIKMWDRIPQHDLFQGNYSTCCIGVGEWNGHYMPHYLMNSAYNMIEIKDNQTGETVGNALCYFAKDETGKPIFIVDNIEIKNGRIPSNTAKEGEKSPCKILRDKITEYAANIAKTVTGKNDTPIYMSNQYNDVPTGDLVKNHCLNQKISFLGDIDCDEIYMDLFGGYFIKTETPDGTKKLPDSKVTLLRLF